MRQIKITPYKFSVILLGVVIFPAFKVLDEPIPAQSIHLITEAVNIKSDVLKVLKSKCNVCHETKKPSKVFTSNNMSMLAPKIYKQVFIKKRMPKGNKIRLTNKEYDILKRWLLTLNIY